MKRRQIFQAGFIMVTSASGLGHSAWGARGNDDYRIQRATYGTAQRSVDVTDRIRELARSDQRFVLKNETFGVDPDRGRPKMLRIFATDANGRSRTFEYAEGSWVDAAQFSSRGGGHSSDDNDWQRPDHRDEYRILRAQYGTPERNIDVTQRLRELASRDSRFVLRNETFGSDPHPGRHKTLRIFARGPNGRTRVFEYPESSWVDGAQFSGWGSGDWGHGHDGRGWEDQPSGGGPDAHNDRDLRILRADYGAGQRRVDVTSQLQGQIFDGRLNVRVGNHLAGDDPAPGVPKQLRLTYLANGRQHQRILNEREYLSIP